MPKTWVLVANSSQAKIFSGKGQRGPLTEIENFDYPNGRLHEGDLVSDSAGSDGGSAGQGRHVLDDETSARQQQAITFAKELASYLDEERKKGGFKKLVVIAPPTFLGILRKNLNDEVMTMVSQQIDKNFINKSAEEIHRYL
ncbi:MAG: Host attachment protein [Piscirickettsiaceae bacterium]|nr:MAG: Host attachment protein [Piscirickettsiaceae bacterium]PCI65721.1 MAG: Host attachment protein [Piscirickettsiaceae bacterium]